MSIAFDPTPIFELLFLGVKDELSRNISMKVKLKIAALLPISRFNYIHQFEELCFSG